MVKVLTRYHVISRDQYLTYDHLGDGASGSVMIRGRGPCLWSIEPDYAAVVTLPNDGKVYLLRPDLKVPAAQGK